MSIRWFRAPPGAKVIEGPSPYRSRNWRLQQKPWSGPGEVNGAARRWDGGANVVGYTGLKRCGSDLAWSGALLSRDEPITTDTRGVASCCQVADMVGSGGGEGGAEDTPVSIAVQLIDLSVTVPDVTLISLNNFTYFQLASSGPGIADIQLDIPDAGIATRGLMSFETQVFSGRKKFNDQIIVGAAGGVAAGFIYFMDDSTEVGSRITVIPGPSTRDVLSIVAGITPGFSGTAQLSLTLDHYLGEVRIVSQDDLGTFLRPRIWISNDEELVEGFTGFVDVQLYPSGNASLKFVSGLLVEVI